MIFVPHQFYGYNLIRHVRRGKFYEHFSTARFRYTGFHIRVTVFFRLRIHLRKGKPKPNIKQGILVSKSNPVAILTRVYKHWIELFSRGFFKKTKICRLIDNTPILPSSAQALLLSHLSTKIKCQMCIFCPSELNKERFNKKQNRISTGYRRSSLGQSNRPFFIPPKILFFPITS